MTNKSPVGLSYTSILLIIAALVLLAGTGMFLFAEEEEIVIAIPVQFEHVPPDMIPVVDTAPVLEVRLRGPSKVIQNAEDLQPSCHIDLAEVEPGPLLIRVSPDMIKVPRRVSVSGIEPASFSITIDRRGEKTVPVVPDLNQDPATGYVIGRVTATPSMVKLTGPATILEEISALRTTPIDIAGLTESTKKTVALNLNHQPHVRAKGESLVEVEIVVEPKLADKWMSLPVRATGGDKACIITPNKIEILLRGPMNVLKNLTEEDSVQAYVDLTGLKPGTYVRPVVIKPPLNITLVEAKPEAFTVKVLKSNRPTER